MRIAFYGSSLLSSYWNGAATYYRGHPARRSRVAATTSPSMSRTPSTGSSIATSTRPMGALVVYPATAAAMRGVAGRAGDADIVVKASGVGVFDGSCSAAWSAQARPDALRIFWDVDAAATLDEMRADPAHPVMAALPRIDMVLTYGGGPPVVDAYRASARRLACRSTTRSIPTTHLPVAPDRALRRRSRLPGQPAARSRGAGGGILPRARGGAARRARS